MKSVLEKLATQKLYNSPTILTYFPMKTSLKFSLLYMTQLNSINRGPTLDPNTDLQFSITTLLKSQPQNLM